MNDFELDKLYIAGTYKRFPVEIVSGKGSIVEDNNGKKYIDMGSGIGVTAFGIADEQWIKAVDDQIHKIQHMSNLYYTEPDIKLAQMLCQRTGMKKVFFCNSGAESNECAIKVARKYAAEKYGSDRYTIVTLKNSFHGRTLTTLAATGQDVFHKLFQPLTPGFACIDPGDIDQLKAIHDKTPVAGVLIECIQGEGGVMPLDKEFVKALYEYCQEKDIVFMVDEVQTGNGRSGHLYSYTAFDVKPDVVSTAKGLAGGLPFGATMMGEKCENILGPGDHGSTFGGNPVCSAAALSVLSRIDDGLLADVRAKSKYIFDQLSNAEGVESVSGMGLMIGIKTKKAAIDVVNECIEKGVLCLTAKDRVRLLPALNIPMEVLKVAVEVIQDSCAD